MATNNHATANARQSDKQDDLAAAGTQVRERFHDLTEDARELASETARLASHSLDPVEKYIKTNPVRSALVATGVGFVLGFIFRGR